MESPGRGGGDSIGGIDREFTRLADTVYDP